MTYVDEGDRRSMMLRYW